MLHVALTGAPRCLTSSAAEQMALLLGNKDSGKAKGLSKRRESFALGLQSVGGEGGGSALQPSAPVGMASAASEGRGSLKARRRSMMTQASDAPLTRH